VLPPGRKRQELALSLLLSIYPMHHMRLRGGYTLGRTAVFSPPCHKPPAAAQQQQCEHRVLKVGLGTGGCASNHSQDKL